MSIGNTVFNGMIAILLAKFLINDLPHAAGLTGNPVKALLTPGQHGGNPLYPEELDPAVRDLVVALNAAGYTTKGSCEGHLLITGRITNAYIEFISGVIKTSEDRQRVREIITSYTSAPIMWLRSDEVRFRGSLREKPTASPVDAIHLLEDLERGGGGPGRSVEKILSMYDVEDLKEMSGLYSSSPGYERPPTTAQLRYIAGLRQRLKMTITYERQVVTFGEAGRMIRELEAEEKHRKGLKSPGSFRTERTTTDKILDDLERTWHKIESDTSIKMQSALSILKNIMGFYFEEPAVVAWDNTDLVGIAVYRTARDSDLRTQETNITELASFTHKPGVGGLLVDEVIKIAGEVGSDTIRVRHGPGARGFYEKLGFTVDVEHPEIPTLMVYRLKSGNPTMRVETDAPLFYSHLTDREIEFRKRDHPLELTDVTALGSHYGEFKISEEDLDALVQGTGRVSEPAHHKVWIGHWELGMSWDKKLVYAKERSLLRENGNPNTTTGEEIAKELGIRYDGIQESIGMQFTDTPQTGTTFYGNTLEEVRTGLAEKRGLFEQVKSNPTVHVDTNEEVLQSKVSGVAIAWVGSKDVGSLHYELEINGTGEILFMQVDEEYRGLGVGKKMYQAVENLAERYGVKKLTAEVGIPGYGDIERAKRFWGSVGFTITNDYAEKWLKSGNPNTATGTCYPDAWRFLIKQGEGYLIHGSVQLTAEGPRVNHAWVELPTGFIWEPQTKSYYTIEDFKIMSPIEEHRYADTEAAIMFARVGKHGPWTAEERMKHIGR